ncbi:hypothetical protein MNBD_GAMMA17-499 [hydrothermal vent metagenome]|uniref:DUF3015 domain-containing protein n=1 Tax=hydrothermal vent metagenome TaxID=652676 RepID=A0A3B0Z342_9ZZZZ
MKKTINTLAGLVLMLLAGSSQAFDNHVVGIAENSCYGQAMVGMDSVINSRLGVPAEHALGLSLNSSMHVAMGDEYSTSMLNTILAAYLWKDTPHSYAIKVFYACAARSSMPLQSASN